MESTLTLCLPKESGQHLLNVCSHVLTVVIGTTVMELIFTNERVHFYLFTYLNSKSSLSFPLSHLINFSMAAVLTFSPI